MSDRAPILLAAHQGIVGSKDGLVERLLARFEQTNGTYEFLSLKLPPDCAGGENRTDFELGYYVRSGSLEVTVGAVSKSLKAGDYLHMSAGEQVTFASDPDEETEVLILRAPGQGSAGAPLLVKPADGPCVGVVGDLYRFLTTSEQTQGRYSIFEAIVPPGGGPPPHVHSKEEELFYVLEGTVSFLIDGAWQAFGPGAFANMPTGFPHAFQNQSDTPARMLIGAAPAGLEKMFMEVGVPLADRDAVPPKPTAEDIGRLLGATSKYGVEILMPKH